MLEASAGTGSGHAKRSPAEPIPDWRELIRRFDGPEAQALALVGSYARGDANPFSDVDLVRFTTASVPSLPDSGSHLVDGRLVVVSDAPPDEVETWFVQPELAVSRLPGLRQGRPLRDRGGYFAALQVRAQAFVWDTAMQARADAFANQAMVGWVEEVHKGLAGLRSGGVGRLLDAEFGLSWGLNRLVYVQRGVLLAGEIDWSKDWFEQAEQVVGPETEWARLRRRVFGITAAPTPTLRERLIAGLWFYVATVDLLSDVWRPPADQLVDHAVRLVRDSLGEGMTPYADAERGRM
ncbi:MAG: nucleotidyltransferase domain-containing protein [Chloroflexi bacterium]|nr:nucleotidyltransferase domain-containing protein [Chloroflexota bacterium]